MRIAIVSDIHNLTALDAMLADLRQQKPDVIFPAATCLTEDRIPPR